VPYCAVNGIRVYYEVQGEGPPMVLAHANPFDHRLWMYQIAHFSTFFKVAAVDIRAYGRSDKPAAETSLPELAADLAGVCRQEKITQAILCGISVGGNIVLQAALDHPELCSALVMAGCSSGPSPHQTRTEGYMSRGVAGYHIQHLKHLVSSEFAATRLGDYLLRFFTDTDPRLKPEALSALFRALERKNLTSRLGELQMPVLVLNGEFDPARPRSIDMSRSIKGAVHRTVAASGHACCLEQPAAFDEAVSDFLKENGLWPSP